MTNEQLTQVVIELTARIEHLEEKLKTKTKRFQAPTTYEVGCYMQDRGCYDASQAESFVTYFEQVGWKVGKTHKPMKDWKAAVRNWLKNYQPQDVKQQKQAVRQSLRNIGDTNW